MTVLLLVVKNGIKLIINSANLTYFKINCVLMKGLNDDEIVDFIEMTKEQVCGYFFIIIQGSY